MEHKTLNKSLIALQNHIVIKKNYCAALHKRIEFINIGLALKTEAEKNEIDIQIYETLNKISIVESQIKKLETEFESELAGFMLNLKICDENFDNTIEAAKKMQKNSIEIKHILHAVNWKTINEDPEEKIALYQSLVDLGAF